MQSSSIGKCGKDIQLLNKYFFIIFSYILFFKLALFIRCAKFAASPLHLTSDLQKLNIPKVKWLCYWYGFVFFKTIKRWHVEQVYKWSLMIKFRPQLNCTSGPASSLLNISVIYKCSADYAKAEKFLQNRFEKRKTISEAQ